MLLVAPAPVMEKFSPVLAAIVPRDPNVSVLVPAVVESCTIPAPAEMDRMPIVSLLPTLLAL